MTLLGREKELGIVRAHLRAGKNLLVTGEHGIGKTALVQEAVRDWPGTLYCADTTTLKTTCESLLAALGRTMPLADNIARKRAVLNGIRNDKRWIVLDHVGRVSPKLESFLETLHQTHPMIIVTPNPASSVSGHLKLILWDFERLELRPLPREALRQLLRIHLREQPENFENDLLRLARGNPGRLLELCNLARQGRYVSAQLLDLDRRIAKLNLP